MKLETLKAMSDLHRPIQSLSVTFADGIDGIRMLSVLNAYSEKGYVEFESKVLVLAILATQDWDRTGRKLVMYFTHGLLWDEDGFLSLAERGIESIRVASDSPLNALQSGREKKREEAYATIAGAVLTPVIRSEIAEWGLTVEHALSRVNDLSTICISVKNGDRIVFRILLDGWSGSIFTGNLVTICFCSTLETAQREVRNALVKYLEDATA